MTPIETIVRHVLERAAKAAKDRHEVWEAGDGFHDADGFPAVSCDVTACANIATAILALPIDQIVAEVEAMLPDAAKVEALVARVAEAEEGRGRWEKNAFEAGHGLIEATARAEAAEAALSDPRRAAGVLDTFYIDCEFDGHNGPLLSIAMVRADGRSLYVKTDAIAHDLWVIENVLPIMDSHHADLSWRVHPRDVGTPLRGFIGDCRNPTFIADSPVDIGRFCRAISTGEDGRWHSTGYPGMTFIVRNVNCYPTTLEGAVQHNAWWDAMALRALSEGTQP